MTKPKRNYSQRTIKILFALSGNQCAYPGCKNPAIVPATEKSDALVLNQICHIYALNEDGPRGKAGLTEKELNSPENMILFCPTHHVIVDGQHETYPAEILKQWKQAHEMEIRREGQHISRLRPYIETNNLKSTPKVFISYSWDDDSHKLWVADLATRLRNDGVETILDQWHAVPGDQLPQFMEKEIRDNDYVLIICTPQYRKKFDERIGNVGLEGDIMAAEVQTLKNNRKFIPILANGKWDKASPSLLKGKYYIDLSTPAKYDRHYPDLLTTVLRSRLQPPPVKRRIRTDERTRYHLDVDFRPISYVHNEFVSNGDHTITDMATGLTWHQEGSVRPMNYAEVGKYTSHLNKHLLGNRNKWRLPEIMELIGLLEPQKQDSGLYLYNSFTIKPGWYWSSELLSDSQVCCIDFRNGVFGSSRKEHSNFAIAVSN